MAPTVDRNSGDGESRPVPVRIKPVTTTTHVPWLGGSLDIHEFFEPQPESAEIGKSAVTCPWCGADLRASNALVKARVAPQYWRQVRDGDGKIQTLPTDPNGIEGS